MTNRYATYDARNVHEMQNKAFAKYIKREIEYKDYRMGWCSFWKHLAQDDPEGFKDARIDGILYPHWELLGDAEDALTAEMLRIAPDSDYLAEFDRLTNIIQIFYDAVWDNRNSPDFYTRAEKRDIRNHCDGLYNVLTRALKEASYVVSDWTNAQYKSVDR